MGGSAPSRKGLMERRVGGCSLAGSNERPDLNLDYSMTNEDLTPPTPLRLSPPPKHQPPPPPTTPRCWLVVHCLAQMQCKYFTRIMIIFAALPRIGGEHDERNISVFVFIANRKLRTLFPLIFDGVEQIDGPITPTMY